MSSSNPSQILGTPNKDVSNGWLSGEGVRTKESTCFDLFILDGKDSRLSQMSQMFYSCMLSNASNPLYTIKLHNLMEK